MIIMVFSTFNKTAICMHILQNMGFFFSPSLSVSSSVHLYSQQIIQKCYFQIMLYLFIYQLYNFPYQSTIIGQKCLGDMDLWAYWLLYRRFFVVIARCLVIQYINNLLSLRQRNGLIYCNVEEIVFKYFNFFIDTLMFLYIFYYIVL